MDRLSHHNEYPEPLLGSSGSLKGTGCSFIRGSSLPRGQNSKRWAWLSFDFCREAGAANRVDAAVKHSLVADVTVASLLAMLIPTAQNVLSLFLGLKKLFSSFPCVVRNFARILLYKNATFAANSARHEHNRERSILRFDF
jgi:hypothetical protein